METNIHRQSAGIELPEAIGLASTISPDVVEGYKMDIYKDKKSGKQTPVLLSQVTKEKIFTVFLELTSVFGDNQDIILEGSHQYTGCGSIHSLNGDYQDLAVLQSKLIDHEELLVNDGRTEIDLIDFANKQELQFDEHKMFMIYSESKDLFNQYVSVLHEHNIHEVPSMRFAYEYPHAHITTDDYQECFWKLAVDLGVLENGFMGQDDSWGGY